ncbi:hypothetical protein SAMN05216420_10422 [Nitrosospira sp. Nl5]|uniref:hypothetical protein n=1 Tax=Nitrosospira sp. Nl5 TaxID=200120 RepID=UPI00089273CB|nr:hypothetical protein [Nitrosospira sp. Nl5]SCY25941.1 hypothetical protein SAMN05216420_10422 [Nitrosospira sp. Nl5]
MEIKVAGCPLGAKCEEIKTEDEKPVIYRCPWYVQVRGVDVNTGQQIDNWGCAIAWMPTLMINTANESRKGAAATESFRNAMVKQETQAQQVRLAARRLLQGEDSACE